MSSRRSLLSLLLCATFLVQSLAASAGMGGPCWKMLRNAAVAQAQQDAPCHHMAAAAPSPTKAVHDCCDGGCPGMVACALGHLGAVSVALPAPAMRPAVIAAALSDPYAPAPPVATLLRPPIALHG